MYEHSDHGHEGQNSAANVLFPETLPLLFAFFLHIQHWPVLLYHVVLEVTGCYASKITLTTFKWLFSSVLAHVGSEVSGLCTRIIAFYANEGLVP